MNPKVEEEALEVVVAIVAVIVVVVAVAGVAVVEEVVVVAEEEVEVLAMDVAAAMEAAEAMEAAKTMEVAAMEMAEVAAYGSQKEAEEKNITIPIAQFLVTPDTILVRCAPCTFIHGVKVFQKE